MPWVDAVAAAISLLWRNKPYVVGSYPLAPMRPPFCYSEMVDTLSHVIWGSVQGAGGAEGSALPPTLAPLLRAKRFSISTQMPFVNMGVMRHGARMPSLAKGGNLQWWSYTCALGKRFFYHFSFFFVFVPWLLFPKSQTVAMVM